MLKQKKYALIIIIIAAIFIIGIYCTYKISDDGFFKNNRENLNNAYDITEYSEELFAMDTYMTLTAYGEKSYQAVKEAIEEIKSLDNNISTGNADSEVTALNNVGEGILSKDVAYLVEQSLQLYDTTEGLFDIAVYPIMEEWGFTTKNYKVPSGEKLAKLVECADLSKVKYDYDTKEIILDDGMKIDLGGIAKGYTSSKIIEIFKKNGITSGLVNLGGNVQVLGRKSDGSKWKIAIQSPYGEDDYLGILSIEDKAIITSGGYERYFEENGIKYHHIINPKTGYPSDSDLVSVTIVSDNGTLADGLSTSLFIMGKDKAIEYWEKHSEEFDVVLFTKSNDIYISEGISNDFTTDYSTTVIG
jgi:thiamine biosynthesis lipoprotein